MTVKEAINTTKNKQFTSRLRTKTFAASVFRLGRRIASSYLPPAISANIAKIEDTSVNSPNSSLVYIRVKAGEIRILISCAIAVPVISFRIFFVSSERLLICTFFFGNAYNLQQI